MSCKNKEMRQRKDKALDDFQDFNGRKTSETIMFLEVGHDKL